MIETLAQGEILADMAMTGEEAMERLSRAGVPTTLILGPVIPGLNDSEVETVLEASAEAGAVSARYILVRLPRKEAFAAPPGTGHGPPPSGRVRLQERSLRSAVHGPTTQAYSRRLEGFLEGEPDDAPRQHP